MRSERRSVSVRLTLVPGGDGQVRSGSVSTTYGCARVDGITWHRIQSQALSELLSDLERQAGILESKSFAVLDTLNLVIRPRVERLLSTIETDITEEEEG